MGYTVIKTLKPHVPEIPTKHSSTSVPAHNAPNVQTAQTAHTALTEVMTPEVSNTMGFHQKALDIHEFEDAINCFVCCKFYSQASANLKVADEMFEMATSDTGQYTFKSHNGKSHEYTPYSEPFWFFTSDDKKVLKTVEHLKHKEINHVMKSSIWDGMIFVASHACLFPPCYQIYKQNIEIQFYEKFVSGESDAHVSKMLWAQCGSRACIASFLCPGSVAVANQKATESWAAIEMGWDDSTDASLNDHQKIPSHDRSPNFLREVFQMQHKIHQASSAPVTENDEQKREYSPRELVNLPYRQFQTYPTHCYRYLDPI